MLAAIEKVILAANIGVTPQNNGEFIRLVIPAPTEERRRELVKKAKQDAEQTKVAIRNIRRAANDDAKKLKDDGIAEGTPWSFRPLSIRLNAPFWQRQGAYRLW
jgi:ribosome recycling factor